MGNWKVRISIRSRYQFFIIIFLYYYFIATKRFKAKYSDKEKVNLPEVKLLVRMANLDMKKVNYKIFVEIEDHWYRKENTLLGCREFLVQDPNGYLLRFSQDLGEKDV